MKQSAVAHSGSAATGPRVLLLDGDRVLLRALGDLLRRDGCDVRTATALPDAERELAAGGVDLVIVDPQTAGAPGGACDDWPASAAAAAGCAADQTTSPDGRLVRRWRKRYPGAGVVVLTGFASVPAAVEATRLGAMEYLSKPIGHDTFRSAVGRALARQALRHDRAAARPADPRDPVAPATTNGPPAGVTDWRESTPTGTLAGSTAGSLAVPIARPGSSTAPAIIGQDTLMRAIDDTLAAVAPARTTVLLVGESGTGKSLLARAIHERSPRRGRPFVQVSCGALSETLLESELFGHVKGSFTGALADKPGRFAAADGGTIFLDEINSCPPAMQVRLLRVLQERTFEPVGSSVTQAVDARVILATNADLSAMVAAGTFRQDLFYRINVVPVRLPSLRERRGDVLLLAEHFLQRYAAEANRQVLGFSAEATQRLRAYDWPGNVRELENAVERAVVLSRRPTIDAADLPPEVTSSSLSRPTAERPPVHSFSLRLAPATGAHAGAASSSVCGGASNSMYYTSTAPEPTAPEPRPLPLEVALEGPERQIILAALARNAWNRNATAAELDVNRTTLYKKMRKHGLDRGEVA